MHAHKRGAPNIAGTVLLHHLRSKRCCSDLAVGVQKRIVQANTWHASLRFSIEQHTVCPLNCLAHHTLGAPLGRRCVSQLVPAPLFV